MPGSLLATAGEEQFVLTMDMLVTFFTVSDTCTGHRVDPDDWTNTVAEWQDRREPIWPALIDRY